MPDLILDMCYDAIFDGLPVMLLEHHQYFMWDHDTHDIHSLLNFRDNFQTVMDIFHARNLAEEYRVRLAREPETFAPHYSHRELQHSTSEIERYFMEGCAT
jgi:hypothetical protein